MALAFTVSMEHLFKCYCTTFQSVELQGELDEESKQIEKLQQEVSVAQKKYERMFHMKQDEIQTYEVMTHI